MFIIRIKNIFPYYLFLLGLLINYAPKSYAEINLDKKIQSATIINGIKGVIV